MGQFDNNNASISELLVPIKAAIARYIGISLAPALVVIGLAALLTVKLPSYYIADVLISVQPRKLTAKIIDGPTKDDQSERLQSLIFEVISRQRLLTIMDRFNIYPELRGAKSRDVALQRLRKAIEITPERATTGETLAQTFRLTFTYSDPKIAFEVTKAISSLFIDESILSTKGETEGTVEFLDTQLRSARQKLEATEQLVQAFVRQNFGKLPEHLQAGVARLESAQQQLATNSQLITAKTQKLEFLKRELQLEEKDSSPIVESAPGVPVSAADVGDSVGQIESALSILRTRYSDEHPDVIALKKRLEVAKQRSPGGSSSTGKGPRVVGRRLSSDAKGVRREIGTIESELASLNEENTHLKAGILQLEADIQEMPLKEQELIKINRDYANVKANYERMATAREEAVLQRDLVSGQKGTQFRIVDAPAIPESAAGPERLVIFGGGLAFGLGILFLLPVLMMFLNGAYKTRDEVEADLGLPVLGVIPPMETPRSKAHGRRAITLSLAASAMSFVVVGVLIVLLV